MTHPTPLLHLFGHRLRTARRAAHLSQDALARRLEIGRDTLSHYEQGRAAPTLPLLVRMAAELGVHVGYFVPGEASTDSTDEERETLALLGSLPPAARRYVLLFVRHFADRQRCRRFLTHEVFTERDPTQALLTFLERDLRTLEQELQRQRRQPTGLSLQALVGFTSALLMASQVEQRGTQVEGLVQRIAAHGHRLALLVRDLVTPPSNRASA